MAVLAYGMVQTYGVSSEGDLFLYLRMADATHQVNDVEYGPVSATVTDVTLNANLKAFVQSYAETNWDVTFGMLDTVRLIFRVGDF